MTKKTIRVRVDFNFCWTYGVTLETLANDIQELHKLGVTDIDIECGGDGYIEIYAYTERLETDEEYNKRISQIEKIRKLQEDRELKELERLKAKYNQ